jgi:XTP/dITP diphosphohydrolase
LEKLVVATKNKGKLKEIREIFKDMPLEIVSMEEAGFDGDIEEFGSTFEENAYIKAKSVADATGEAALADDSGLVVDFLDGAPGIYSSRFAGEGASDEDRINRLLGLMKDADDNNRTARFVCAAAVVYPDGRSITATGKCEGVIAHEPKGSNGFGYDPVFFVPEYGKTMAELDSETKNKISHRGNALTLLAEMWRARRDSNPRPTD